MKKKSRKIKTNGKKEKNRYRLKLFIMIYKLKIIFLALVFGLIFLVFSCDDKSQLNNQSTSHTVSGKISQPISKNKIKKDASENELDPKKKLNPTKNSNTEAEIKKEDQLSKEKPEQKIVKKESDHYSHKGKIDPFKPLIQEKPPKAQHVIDNRPKRILTPLEKVELSQIRLVAVIIMKNRQIAMVEEGSGKGYEVGIGTYIGKNQGRVSEIKKSSIVVKELVTDFNGRLKERIKEIKLHKIDDEG
ncbi:MAG: pilus assembly protein PilP [Thermodesulfobacteriota bacterium]